MGSVTTLCGVSKVVGLRVPSVSPSQSTLKTGSENRAKARPRLGEPRLTNKDYSGLLGAIGPYSGILGCLGSPCLGSMAHMYSSYRF